jgi:hypothetical protein
LELKTADKEDHEELSNTHSKLEKAHPSLLEQVKMEEAKKEQMIVSYDESFYKPVVITLTNPSCSTFTSSSPTTDGFTL